MPRGRPKGAKNVKTLWRDAEKLIGEDGALQMVDPLCVIETCMRYFYSLAQTGRKANAPLDEVRKCFEKFGGVGGPVPPPAAERGQAQQAPGRSSAAPGGVVGGIAGQDTEALEAVGPGARLGSVDRPQ